MDLRMAKFYVCMYAAFTQAHNHTFDSRFHVEPAETRARGEEEDVIVEKMGEVYADGGKLHEIR